jgi:transcriptional regulator with XRE-family HTH domain
MSLKTDHIKLIFGLKLKQFRQERNLGLNELAAKSGLSMSYINEIEKGKKYPKADKISSLAEALELDYDTLVSLKLSKKLEPISVLLKSNFLTEIPFDFFGIDPSHLLEMLSDAPTKLSAFINTIIKIGRSYSMSVEQFYFAVLRSYQEMYNNYFPELEEFADTFLKEFSLGIDFQIDEFFLTNLLFEKYGISIEYFDERNNPNLGTIRSIYSPKLKKVLINKKITSDQRAFTLARELGFIYMNLKARPLTSSWVEVNSFDEVFNNFQASYFAGAILINKKILIEKIRNLFSYNTFKENNLLEMIDYFQTTPETLLQRIFSLLPQYFGIDKIFFLRFESPKDTKNFKLTKELHLSKLHDPQENKNENYCRRWVAINILNDLSRVQKNNPDHSKTLIQAQFSHYIDADSKYLIISIARPLNLLNQTNVSISIGIEYNKDTMEKIGFMNDPNIETRVVNQTCEKCGIFDCAERVAAPIILQKKRQIKEMKAAINALV